MKSINPYHAGQFSSLFLARVYLNFETKPFHACVKCWLYTRYACTTDWYIEASILWGIASPSRLSIKIPGREYLFARSLFLPFCSDLHIIRHFCSEFWGLKLHQISNCPGLRPDPAVGAYSAPPDPLAGGEGAHCPSPRTPTRSRPFGPRASAPLGRSFVPLPVRKKNSPPQNRFRLTPLLIQQIVHVVHTYCVLLQLLVSEDTTSYRRQTRYAAILTFSCYFTCSVVQLCEIILTQVRLFHPSHTALQRQWWLETMAVRLLPYWYSYHCRPVPILGTGVAAHCTTI